MKHTAHQWQLLSLIFLNIFILIDLAKADSNGIPLDCKYEWNPIAPKPRLLSAAALNLALNKFSGALSIKYCNTLSKNLIKSGINKVSFFHSSYFSKLTLDKQQTAVLFSFVGNVISEHKLEWCTFNPKSFCVWGNPSLMVSINETYGSPVATLVSNIFKYFYINRFS